MWRYNAARGGGWMGWERPPPCHDGWSGRPKNHTDFRPAIMTPSLDGSIAVCDLRPASLTLSLGSVGSYLDTPHVLCGTLHFVSVMRDETVVSSSPPKIDISREHYCASAISHVRVRLGKRRERGQGM